MDQAVPCVDSIERARPEREPADVHHAGAEVLLSASLRHGPGQIDANDTETMRPKEESVSARRRSDLEEGALLLVAKEPKEGVALLVFPDGSGSTIASIHRAIVDSAELAPHVVDRFAFAHRPCD